MQSFSQENVCYHGNAVNVIRRSRYVINPKKETYKPYDLMTYRLQGKRITYAYQRLHANPLDWIKNKTVRRLSYFLEAPPRFELGIKALQASALPLGHGAILSFEK